MPRDGERPAGPRVPGPSVPRLTRRKALTGIARPVIWRPVVQSGARWGTVVDPEHGSRVVPDRRVPARPRRPRTRRGPGALSGPPGAGGDDRPVARRLPGH